MSKSEVQGVEDRITLGDDGGTSSTSTGDRPPAEAALVEDVLVEEVSIDGMCGVY